MLPISSVLLPLPALLWLRSLDQQPLRHCTISVRTLMRRGEYAPQGERVARSQKAIGSSLGMRVPPQSDLLSPGSEYHRTRWVTRQDVADRGAGRWRAQNLIKYIANVSTQDIGRNYMTPHRKSQPKWLRLSALRTPPRKRAVDQDDAAQSLGDHW